MDSSQTYSEEQFEQVRAGELERGRYLMYGLQGLPIRRVSETNDGNVVVICHLYHGILGKLEGREIVCVNLDAPHPYAEVKCWYRADAQVWVLKREYEPKEEGE